MGGCPQSPRTNTRWASIWSLRAAVFPHCLCKCGIDMLAFADILAFGFTERLEGRSLPVNYTVVDSAAEAAEQEIHGTSKSRSNNLEEESSMIASSVVVLQREAPVLSAVPSNRTVAHVQDNRLSLCPSFKPEHHRCAECEKLAAALASDLCAEAVRCQRGLICEHMRAYHSGEVDCRGCRCRA